jgi:hypothetical protein
VKDEKSHFTYFNYFIGLTFLKIKKVWRKIPTKKMPNYFYQSHKRRLTNFMCLLLDNSTAVNVLQPVSQTSKEEERKIQSISLTMQRSNISNKTPIKSATLKTLHYDQVGSSQVCKGWLNEEMYM